MSQNTHPLVAPLLVGGPDELTPEELAERKNGITATDIAAIAGVDPYQTQFAVWLKKTGQAQPFERSTPARRGQFLEKLALEEHCLDVDPDFDYIKSIRKGTIIWHPEHKLIGASPDYFITTKDEEYLLECKSKTYRSAKSQGVGQAGTDELPDAILLQVQQQMLVTGHSKCVVAMLVDDTYQKFVVEANKEVHDFIISIAEPWYNKYVIPRIAPPLDGSEAASAYIRQTLKQLKDDIREATQEEELLIAEFKLVKSQLKELEEKEELLKQQLCVAVGEAAGIRSPSVGGFTWKAQKGKTTTDWKAIARDQNISDEKIKEFTTTGDPIRVARLVK